MTAGLSITLAFQPFAECTTVDPREGELGRWQLTFGCGQGERAKGEGICANYLVVRDLLGAHVRLTLAMPLLYPLTPSLSFALTIRLDQVATLSLLQCKATDCGEDGGCV